jgi:thiol reductant ABC exporter CydC subunit
MRALWNDVASQRREIWLAAFLGFLASASAVALLGTSGWLIARAAEMPPVLTLTVAAVMVRTFALGRGLMRYLERLVGHDAAFRGLTTLRVRVYRSLESITPLGLSRFTRGDLLARLGADVDTALDLPLRVVLPWVQAGIVALATSAFVAWLLPQAGIALAILAGAAVLVWPWIVGRIVRRAEGAIAPARGALIESVVAVVDAASVLTAFGARRPATTALAVRDAQLTRAETKEAGALGVGAAVGMILQGLAVTGAIAVTVPRVVAGEIAPVWLAVIALLPLALFDVLTTVPTAAIARERVRGSAQRLEAIADAAEPVAVEPRVADVVAETFSSLVVESVNARWPGASDQALTDVTLQLRAGERILIMGPSGSGKSTLAAVIMGFLPYQGSARVNGQEISDIGSDAVCRTVGLLSQHAHVFDTSVEENVRLGRVDASLEEIWSALERAQLADWVRSLPEGIDSRVGAFGARMSGGERQRLAVARLLLADRSALVLDEPTEHLDRETSLDIEETIARETRGAAAIIISHQVVEGVDRIIEMREGRIVAQGSHDELMALDGWYAQQVRRQREGQRMVDVMGQLPVGVAVAR